MRRLRPFDWKPMENRAPLLARVVRYELPIEPTVAMLQAYGWDSDTELYELAPDDIIRILDRYLAGELTASDVERWAGLIEVRDDIGFVPAWRDRLQRVIFRLANPAVNAPVTPGLAAELRRLLAGEVT